MSVCLPISPPMCVSTAKYFYFWMRARTPIRGSIRPLVHHGFIKSQLAHQAALVSTLSVTDVTTNTTTETTTTTTGSASQALPLPTPLRQECIVCQIAL